MAFGIKRAELLEWKANVSEGDIAILTHYWEDGRFPGCTSVTKIGCSDYVKLIQWGQQYGLMPEWIHQGTYPHFDVFGSKQRVILQTEGMLNQFQRFCT